MAWIALFASFYYAWWLWKSLQSWHKLPKSALIPDDKYQPEVAVIIAMRNEQDHIRALLDDLLLQSYEAFTVWVVDDASTDRSARIVEDYTGQFPDKIKLIRLTESSENTAKKRALEVAIKASQSDLIVCTDADCRVGQDWLMAMVLPFENGEVNMVCGPVTFRQAEGMFEELQTIEFASLIGIGASGLQQAKPSMCNGANIAYRRAGFETAGGYGAFAGIASGDDEFLMHRFHAIAPGSVVFNKSEQAIVWTEPKPNLHELYQQRKRWASKWKHYQNPHSSRLALGVFLFHLLWMIAPIAWLLSPNIQTDLLLAAFMVRALANYLFLSQILDFLGKPIRVFYYLLMEILYSPYVVLFGLLANFGSYEWKGRKHS